LLRPKNCVAIFSIVYILYTMSFIRRIKRGDKVYLAEVENRWINGRCVQKHIRYVGKEIDGKTVLASSISDIEVEEVKIYGPLMALHHCAMGIGLSQCLGIYGEEILSLVYAHCLDYQSVSKMEQWFERTDLNMLLEIDGVTEKRLLSALDSLEEQNIEVLQRKIFEAVKEKYRLKRSGVLYDVTNTYLYGRHCPLGKPGHDKEGVKGRLLVQIGLGVTMEHGIPMFHKVFDGNVHDSKTLQDLIFQLKYYDVKNRLFVYDRGISSSRNIREVRDLQCDSLCGLPVRGDLKKLLREAITNETFIQFGNRVHLNKTIFYVVTRPHTIDGVKGTLAICFNEQQRKDLRESRYNEIENAQVLLAKGQRIKSGLEKFFDGRGRILDAVLAEAEEFDGYSCIFSTRDLSKDDIVRLYFDKDLIEKAFRTLKGVTRLQPIRHWLYNRVIAHIFICYLSYLLLSLLKYHLKRISVSPEEALNELSTMYKVYLKDTKKQFRISRTVTLTKRQEDIIKCIDPKLLKVV
jgi:transposase